MITRDLKYPFPLEERETVVFISGHGDVTIEEFKKHYKPMLDNYIANGHFSFVVGDFRGADYLAQIYLAFTDAKVTVYHMFDKPRHNFNDYPTVGGFKNDFERDGAMTKASFIDLSWVRPGKVNSGTEANIKRRRDDDQWPTLESRLAHPLTSTVEAIEQLQKSVPITELAKTILEKEKKKEKSSLDGFEFVNQTDKSIFLNLAKDGAIEITSPDKIETKINVKIRIIPHEEKNKTNL